MAQILFKVIPLPLWCVLPCVCLITSEATLLDFGRMTGVLRTSDKSAFSICPPTLMMPSLSRNGFSFLNTVFFPMHDYHNGHLLECFGDLISEGKASLCNCLIISASASSKSATLGPASAELSVGLL